MAAGRSVLVRKSWLVRKEGLEPSRCYPQVPETCASTSSATFAGMQMVATELLTVEEPGDPQVPAFQAGETPEPPLRVYQFRHFRGPEEGKGLVKGSRFDLSQRRSRSDRLR